MKIDYNFANPSFSVLILICIAITFNVISRANSNDVKQNFQAPILASMTWSQEKGFDLVLDRITHSVDTVGWVNFTNAINQTGWSYLEIKTYDQFDDKIQVCMFSILIFLFNHFLIIYFLFCLNNK